MQAPARERGAASLCPTTPGKPKKNRLTGDDVSCEFYINRVNHELCLQLPLDNEVWSPAKRRKSVGTEIVKSMRFLFYKDREALDAVISEVKGRPLLHSDSEVKLQSLNHLVGRAVSWTKDASTPIRTRGSSPKATVETEYDSDDSFITARDADSSTLAAKHLPHLPDVSLNMLDAIDTNEHEETLQNAPPVNRNLRETLEASFYTTGPSTRDVSFAFTTLQSQPTTAATSFSSETHGAIIVNKVQFDHAHFEDVPRSSMTEPLFSSLPSNDVERLDPTPFSDQPRSANDDVAAAPSAVSDKKRDVGAVTGSPTKRQKVSQAQNQKCSCGVCTGKEYIPFPASNSSPPPDKSVSDYRIRDFPHQSFGDGYDYESTGPHELVFERARIARALHKRNPSEAKQLSTEIARLKSIPQLCKFIKEHDVDLEPTGDNVWKETRRDTARTDMCIKMGGHISLNPAVSGSLFQTTLHPLRVEKTCRVQREYGWDRLLVMSVSARDKKGLPAHIKRAKDASDIHQQFLKWLSTEHNFLGRVWRAFFIEPVKGGNNRRKKAETRNNHRVFLFALKGNGITKAVKLSEFVDYIFPISENLHQPRCKSFTRFALAVSATTPTVYFKPEQVIYVEDQLPSKEPEDIIFNDASLPFDIINQLGAMNDGCNVISVAAAELVCKILGMNHRPVAFQARINGAKGIWFIEKPYGTTDPEQQKIWIKIGKSQQKYCVPSLHRDAETCKKNVYSFDVVRTSCPAKRASINRDFLQILVDRHVSKIALADYALQNVGTDMKDLLDSLLKPFNPELLYYWISKHLPEDMWLSQIHECGLPVAAGTTARMLLRAGFEPLQCSLLAESLLRMTDQQLSWLREDYRIPCSKSTSVYGIADPIGVLAPGEIHLAFSSHFEDEQTHESWACLDNKDVVVGRSPALGSCDIQRAKAVYHPQLAHLKDVVVFSSRGKIPLAAKLQGGDYDGDTFWICWDPQVVTPFRNAPLNEVLPPEAFGVRQDKTTLQDLYDDGKCRDVLVDEWLDSSFSFALQEDLLGIVTNYYTALSFYKGDLSLPCVQFIADLHTYLIDAKKNGYSFTRQEFDDVLLHYGLPSVSNLQEHRPIHRKDYPQSWNRGEHLRQGRVTRKPTKLSDLIKAHENKRPSHVLDYVLVRGIDRAISKTLRDLASSLPPAKDLSHDVQLGAFYTQALGDIESDQNFASPAEKKRREHEAKKTLEQAEHDVRHLLKHWKQKMRLCIEEQKDAQEHCVRPCYEELKKISPKNPPSNSVINSWLYPAAPNGRSKWMYIMASMMALKFPHEPHFLFQVAGQILCEIKAGQCGSINTIPRIEAIKKVRKPRTTWQLDDFTKFEDSDEENELDSQSVFEELHDSDLDD